jgi:long-chain acyl-CoA synthetase
MVRDPLPRTRLGKIRRHKLQERYRQAKAGKTETTTRGALPIEDMSDQDRAVLENPAARQVWDWLAGRYSEHRLTPDSSPQLDLGVDSLEWLNLTLEIRNRSGVELKEEAINRIDTVRDLLQEVSEAERTETASPTLPLEQPEEVLSDRQKRWLRPLGPLSSALTWLLFHLNRLMMRSLFRLRVQGEEQLPDQGPFILTPNHASLLDPFAVAAALDQRQLRKTYWGGWTGIAFANPFNRWISRLARAVPIDPGRAAISSLAFAAAVLKQHKNLVWFPEGERSLQGQLQPFKPGIGLLLNHFQTPAIPVYIQGSFEALPRGKRWPRRQPITVRFGAPLPPAELEQQGQGEQPQHRIVQALHDQVERLGEQTAVGENRKI